LYPEHEQQVAELARQVGFNNISASSEIDTKIGFVARGQSATADAYLTPEVRRYLSGFSKGFKGKLEDADCRVSFMQSDGALADFRKFSGLRAILCTSTNASSCGGSCLTEYSWTGRWCRRLCEDLI
jgi:5-oxoprolinase (ATP-hydrolysing)